MSVNRKPRPRSMFVLCALLGFFIMGEKCEAVSLQLSDWRFKPVDHFDPAYRSPDFNDFDWGRVAVPGQWQQLPGLSHYSGRAVYRAAGDFKPEAGKSYFLRFEGVFYKTAVWMNGTRLGEHEGYFEPFEFEVTHALRPGKNVIVVEVECRREKRVTRKEQMLGVFGNWDVIANWRNPGGIWQPVTFYEANTPFRFESLKLTTLAVEPEVRVRVQAKWSGTAPEGANLYLLFSPDNFEGDTVSVSMPAAGVGLDREVTLKKARVWNPWKRGFPHMYGVEAALAVDRDWLAGTETETGFRTLSVEDNFHFIVNGRPMYVKGNNYAPSSVYLSETTRELVENDVAMMKAANYDIIRVHAHVDHPELYRACDRAGLLVFQDAPLQWGYAHDVVPEFTRQLRAMINLLYNHPSIVLWSVHNEPLPSGFDHLKPNPVDLLVSAKTGINWGKPEWNYLVLDAELVKAAREEDPYRPVNRGSGMEDLDFHQYQGWYGGKVDNFGPWIERTQKENPKLLRLATEFGAQSFPNFASSIRFIDKDKPLDRLHLKLNYMWQPGVMDNFMPPSKLVTLKDAIIVSQEYQARMLKYYIERIRLMKYEPNYGCIAFLHNDSQPAITWSVVDVWRSPKPAYSTVAQAYRDPYVMTPFQFAPYTRGETVDFPVYVANDLLASFEGCTVRMIQDGKELARWQAALGPDMKPLRVGEQRVKLDGDGTYSILKLSLSCPGADEVVNTYELKIADSKLWSLSR